MSSPSYSVVVPVYNSTESLRLLCGQLQEVFENVIEAPFEIILVDDGSPNPDTWPTIEALAQQFQQVKGVQLAHNSGKPMALICGLSEACGRYIITMDDDLQHSPYDIPALVAEQEHDVVIARFETLQTSFLRRLASRLKNYAHQIVLSKPTHLLVTPFKLFHSEVVQRMLLLRSAAPSIAALLFSVTRDVVNVPATHSKRHQGRSGFTLRKLWQTFRNLLLSNPQRIWQISAKAGAVLLIGTGSAFVVYLLVHLLLRTPSVEWAAAMAISLVSGGLVMLALGALGSRLTRPLKQDGPLYLVRQRTGGQPVADGTQTV